MGDQSFLRKVRGLTMLWRQCTSDVASNCVVCQKRWILIRLLILLSVLVNVLLAVPRLSKKLFLAEYAVNP